MTHKRITHASLFSGIGGFDLAAEWAGFDNLFNCEIDPFCRLILNYYFPNAIQYGDIKTTDFTPWRGKIDILTGGFPCQPFSLAGQRKGTDDDRYLWPEMLRAISEIRPAWVIGENVGGIVSMVQPGGEVEVATEITLFGEDYYTTQERQEFIIERICRDIEHFGYSIQPILIPACGVGAPHRRDRVWFVAHRTDAGVEAVREWQNGVLSAGAFTDGTDERRRAWPCEADKRQECSQNGRGIQPAVDRPCGDGTSADTKCLGGREIHDQVQSRQPDGTWINSSRGERYVTDAESIGSSITGRTRNGRTGFEDGDCGAGLDQWQNFPTQSPVCRGNDGFPGQLDGFTVPKWRQESIKGFGNAVVPQVPLRIMEAIKEIELIY